jgi:CheY-like chemotaxis protein
MSSAFWSPRSHRCPRRSGRHHQTGSGQWTWCAETGDGQQAADLWKKHRPDITVDGFAMPGLDGVNAIYQNPGC